MPDIEEAKKSAIVSYIEQLEHEFSLSRENLISLLQARSVSYVPLDIFATRYLSCLQSLVVYLKENRGYSFSKTARLLGRDNRTIWTSYQQAKKKWKKPLAIQQKPAEYIPLSIFSDRRFSMLEHVVLFLKKKDYPSKDIAKLLLRKQTTISTVLGRAAKKGETRG